MPTNPYQPLLYRELRKAEARGIIEIASSLLHELVNHATNAFQRCQEAAATGAADEHLPLLTSYYHAIEMTDGIEELIIECCPVPAIPLLRSLFEAVLTIDYITKADYSQRAFSWLVCYVHERLNLYEMLDTSRQRGKEFHSIFKSDNVSKFMQFPTYPNLSEAIQNLESLLTEPNYQLAEIEYIRLYRSRKRRPNWFSLYGGPGTIRELARHLNRGAQYEVLYRGWSHITHATDISRILTKIDDGSPAFNPLRNHKELKQVAKLTATLMFRATHTTLRKFRYGEMKSIGKWYMNEIRGPLQRLLG